MYGTIPPPNEARRRLEITENFCYYPPPHWIATASGDHRKFLLLPPPPLNRDGFRRSENISATTTPPPTESRRLPEITENFCYYPPPPTESRRPGTSHERGPLRKILDLRLLLRGLFVLLQLGRCNIILSRIILFVPWSYLVLGSLWPVCQGVLSSDSCLLMTFFKPLDDSIVSHKKLFKMFI